MTKARTIGIVVFDGVRICEVAAPAEVFALARKRTEFEGSEVLLIGVEDQPTITTTEGLEIRVDCTIQAPVQLDVLIIPGAYDVDPLLQHAPLNAFIQRQAEGAEWVASYCAGAFLLGSAGVLDGKKATTWHGGEDDLQAQFPKIEVVREHPVVIDDRRITANAGLVSYRAALVLLAKLTSVDVARKVYEGLGMDRLGTWADIEAESNTVLTPANA